MPKKPYKPHILNPIVGIVLLVVVGGGFWWFVDAGKHLESEHVTTLLFLLGVIALVLTLTVSVVFFKYMHLTTKDGAFGLPVGTFRAVIAMSLILIFSMMSVSLYQRLQPKAVRLNGLTQEQVDAIPGQSIVALMPADSAEVVPSRFNVALKIDPNTASTDFAKQLLTTLSTLVVAIVGFYFGTKVAIAPTPQEPDDEDEEEPSGKEGALEQ